MEPQMDRDGRKKGTVRRPWGDHAGRPEWRRSIKIVGVISEFAIRTDRAARVPAFEPPPAPHLYHAVVSDLPTTPKLFQLFPARDDASLIMRWGSRQDEVLEDQFIEAADRLARSFNGEPIDDFILIPWLYLYRHAMELTMKRAIVISTYLRRKNDEADASLDQSATLDRLKYKHGHRLGALLNELLQHLQALDLPTIPKETRKIVLLLAEADPRGESLRYQAQLPDTVDRIDFGAMSSRIMREYRILAATIDVLSAYEDSQNDYLEEIRQFESDLEAEYRDYYH